MKKIILITLVALFAATTTQAKTEQNPKGLYRLKQFIYEDGSTAPPNNREMPGAIQYIYAADTAGLIMYNFGYDVFGAEQTLLYLDAFTLMAPSVASEKKNKQMILKCRANCYLLQGNKEEADKLLKQAEEIK